MSAVQQTTDAAAPRALAGIRVLDLTSVVMGPYATQIRPTTKFSETPSSISRGAPTLGEHTVEVLLDAGFQRGPHRPIAPRWRDLKDRQKDTMALTHVHAIP